MTKKIKPSILYKFDYTNNYADIRTPQILSFYNFISAFKNFADAVTFIETIMMGLLSDYKFIKKFYMADLKGELIQGEPSGFENLRITYSDAIDKFLSVIPSFSTIKNEKEFNVIDIHSDIRRFILSNVLIDNPSCDIRQIGRLMARQNGQTFIDPMIAISSNDDIIVLIEESRKYFLTDNAKFSINHIAIPSYKKLPMKSMVLFENISISGKLNLLSRLKKRASFSALTEGKSEIISSGPPNDRRRTTNRSARQNPIYSEDQSFKRAIFDLPAPAF